VEATRIGTSPDDATLREQQQMNVDPQQRLAGAHLSPWEL